MGVGLGLGLAAAVAYGAADFVGGAGSRRYSSLQVALVGQCAGALLMLVAAGRTPGDAHAADFGWALLAGAGSATGSLFLFRGLSRGRMGLIAPISAVGAAVLPVLVGVALGERPTWLAWLGVLVALPGIWLVSRESTAAPAGSTWALLDGAAAGAGFGVLFIALGQISSGAGLLPLAASQLFGVTVAIAVAATLREAWLPRRSAAGVVTWGGASGLLGAGGTLAFTAATGVAELSVTAVLASLYPAVTVLLATTLLGERLGTGQRLGIGMCTLAVATLTFA